MLKTEMLPHHNLVPVVSVTCVQHGVKLQIVQETLY